MASNKAGLPVNSFATDTSTVANVAVGTVVEDVATGKTYKYVQAEDLALTVGDVVEYSDTTGYEVTKDRAGGSSIGRIVAGVALGAIADASYGWIQVTGVNAYVKTDNSVAASNALVPHATTNGVADVAESGSEATNTEAQVFGYALTTDTTTTTTNCTAILRCAYQITDCVIIKGLAIAPFLCIF